jgi:hypothetical protein
MKPLKLLPILLLLITAWSVPTLAQITTGEIPDQPIQVRVVDNKGTIKYLQVQNGLTMMTNTTGNINTTTWQLGGTLENNTTINLNGKFFQLQNMVMNTSPAATSNGAVTTMATNSTGPGLTIVMRDQTTGALITMLASDLIQAGQAEYEVGAANNIAVTTPSIIPGLPATYEKVSVYRNGSKLRANVDYTIGLNTLILVDRSAITVPVNQRWALFNGDIIEVHWVR